MRSPTLLRRFPSWRFVATSSPVVPVVGRAAYPHLAEDLAVLDDVLDGPFQEADRAALTQQNRYRRQQVTVLLGAVLTTAVAGLQAVFPEQRWLGVLLAVVGIALATTSRLSGELDVLSGFLSQRVKAERLRGLHFLFLSRTGPYGPEDRESVLRRAVRAVQAGREP